MFVQGPASGDTVVESHSIEPLTSPNQVESQCTSAQELTNAQADAGNQLAESGNVQKDTHGRYPENHQDTFRSQVEGFIKGAAWPKHSGDHVGVGCVQGLPCSVIQSDPCSGTVQKNGQNQRLIQDRLGLEGNRRRAKNTLLMRLEGFMRQHDPVPDLSNHFASVMDQTAEVAILAHETNLHLWKPMREHLQAWISVSKSLSAD